MLINRSNQENTKSEKYENCHGLFVVSIFRDFVIRDIFLFRFVLFKISRAEALSYRFDACMTL